MNLSMTPEEILFAFESAIQNPHPDPLVQESLLGNLRRPILESLQEKQERLDEHHYGLWAEKESKKIKDLEIDNESIGRRKVSSMRSRSSRLHR